MKKFFAMCAMLLAFGFFAVVPTAAYSAKEASKFLEACRTGNIKYVELTIRTSKVLANAKTDNGYTALMFATFSGHADIAELLIRRGADAKAQNNDGMTALMYAVREGHTGAITLLCSRSDLNAKDNAGHTALTIAALNGHTDMARILIKKAQTWRQRTIMGTLP